MAASGPLAGRSAVITGASRGIGLECARSLHAQGATVALLARSADRLEAEYQRLRISGPAAGWFQCDVGDAESVGRATRSVREFLGEAPDIVVNNAATFFLRPAEQTTVEDFAHALQVNVVGAFRLVREFLPAMRERGHGHIVTIGSIADHRAFRGSAAYGASKYALRGLHEVLRAELRGTGVRASLISPGHTDTAIWDGVDADLMQGVPPRETMLPARAVAEAVRYVVTQSADVNVDELRISRS